MTHYRMACALLAFSLFPTAQVLGQGNSRRDEGRRDEDCRDDRGLCVINRDISPEQPWLDDRRDGRRDDYHNDRQSYRRDEQHGDRQDGNHADCGAGPDHAYYRGNRLPAPYRSYQNVVEDWRGHGLRSPPPGYHWVQTGADYVLVAIATGVILELLLSR